jgi:YbbR domain-containing protein
MARVTRKKYNTKKIRTFLLFLGIACVIWVLTKFSKVYTATINGDISYTSFPENTVLGDGNAKDFSFEVTAVGFKFIQYQLNRPRIEIPLNNYSIDETDKVTLESRDLNRLITSELGKDVSITNLSLSQLVISLDRVGSKMVPVTANTKIKFREGFKSVKGAVLTPDSVKIFAPNNLLSEIDSIPTVELTLNDVHERVALNLKLELPGNEDLKVEPDIVDLQMDVTEFTQKTVAVPIEVINVPTGTTVKMIPEILSISFDVAMESFNDISASDFRVFCDFASKNNEENFMLVEISRQPEGIYNIEFSEKKIDYLIFK